MADPGDEKRLVQIALNESTFRAINEQIYGQENQAGALHEFTIVCECGADDCNTTLTVDATLYRDVRADPNRFLVTAGHEIADAEMIVEQHGQISVVEKLPGEARDVAEATDPRSPDSPG
jgi:hypothetical protein